jgi:hypothetical protein
MLRRPMREYFQATKDCVCWELDFEMFQTLFHSIESFREQGRATLVGSYFAMKERNISMITDQAKDRYARLMKEKPDIFRNASLKHIATYLGITDTSLSRIRKEIVNKNRIIMLFGIINIILGTLVLSPSFIGREKREKYAKTLSWAGILLLIWGIMGVVSSLSYFQSFSLYWILWFSGGVISLLMGIILGIGLLKRSSAGIVNKLLPYQRIIGLIAIIIGVLQLFVQA